MINYSKMSYVYMITKTPMFLIHPIELVRAFLEQCILPILRTRRKHIIKNNIANKFESEKVILLSRKVDFLSRKQAVFPERRASIYIIQQHWSDAEHTNGQIVSGLL